MSEFIDESAEVAAEPELKDTFSFFDVLEERTYPTDEVTISIDEAAAYELSKLGNRLRELRTQEEEPTEADFAEIEAQADALKERIEASSYTFYLKGVSDDRVSDVKEVVDGKFEDKKRSRKRADGTLHKELPESEALNYARYLNATVFSLHIQKIRSHKDGREMVAPSPDELAYFFDKAPSAAQDRVSTALQSLRVASSAYESTLDEGFFPKP